MTQDEINRAIKWFYYSQIRTRYASQLPQKLDKDIGIVVNSKQPFDDLLGNIRVDKLLEIKSEDFVGVDISNALWGLMRWYFKSKNAVCLTTGMSIRKNMGQQYSLECDHIFPSSRLKEIGYGRENRLKYALAQEITNRAILTQAANRTKTNGLAKDYLAGVKHKFPNALKLQCIPEDESLWDRDNYEQFLQTRRKILTKELNDFLTHITVSKESEVAVSIEDMIEEGESGELEFKASFRTDYPEGTLNKKLETVIMKTVSAFSNGEGGVLLIGVNDEGDIVGLEHDYSSLEGTKDEFEVHMRNMLNPAFGITFTSLSVKITFPDIEGIEICRVDIEQGNEPVYLNIADKHGNKQAKFYVRSGNSSQEVPLTEISSYIDARFKKQ